MNQNNPRNPLMAAVMSMVLPGFGQLYNGHLNRGILLFISICLCSVPMILWVTLHLPASFTLPMVILNVVTSLGLWLYGIVDAYRSAKHLSEYTLKSWQVPAMYLATFLISVFMILPILTNYVRQRQMESFHIPSGSMEPSVMRGDVLFADKSYNCHACRDSVNRGDIAVFVYPNNRTRYYIKRVVGLPGDRIRLEGQQVFVNGKSLGGKTVQDGEHLLISEQTPTTTYQVKWAADNAFTKQELTVPQGEVFVLGDNRSASNDSRKFGTVPIRDVVGQASQVWLSIGEDGLRWDRLGLVLQ